MSVFDRVTTKDILAVMVVGASLIFNGISLTTGNPLDPTTIGFSGIIIGHYFRGAPGEVAREPEPLPEPSVPGEDASASD